jgi:hypothetical protein
LVREFRPSVNEHQVDEQLLALAGTVLRRQSTSARR